VHSLLLACLPPDEPQFRGIRRALTELGSEQGCWALHWAGEPLRLRRRRALRAVLVTGHGREARAGFAACSPQEAAFGPSALALPSSCRLYLAACFQGRADLRAAWAEGADLLEEGAASLQRWFAAWLEANDALRPHFPRIRQCYRDNAGDPLATLAELAGLARETGTEEFVSVLRRRPEYLTGLI
jgi:hypothetical protein